MGRTFLRWCAPLAASVALFAACGGDPEVVNNDDGFDGGAAAGGASGAGGSAGSGASGGSIGIGGGTGAVGGSGIDGGSPCDTSPCEPGQRCEVVDGGASCIDNSCDDLNCAPEQKCEPHPQGGHVCADNSCQSDTDCDESEYCNGTACVADACEPGARECDGQELLECTSNGGESAPQYSCGSTSYFPTQCEAGAAGEAGCSCEDDWDCPANTVCEVGGCVGTGVAPSCTLPAVPFADVPPAVELFWGGLSQADSLAKDGTGADAPWNQYSHAVGTPIVANLDDDNGDGLINELDFPDILFITHEGNNPWSNGVVRAIHGGGPNKGKDYFARCGAKLWTETTPTGDSCASSDADADAGAPVAVGDLNGDGVPEIVYPTEDDTFVILDNSGVELYRLDTPWAPSHVGRTIAIANLDYAGYAELIVGRNVYVLDDAPGGGLTVTHILSGDLSQGTNLDNGGNGTGIMACPADLSPDFPGQEIVAGASLYRLPDALPSCGAPPCAGPLTKVWHAPEQPGWPGQLTGEGFCAVADVWGGDAGQPPGPANPPDGKPEVLLIDDGRLVVLDGETGARIDDLSLGGGDKGGAPNVDDFDGDGFAEVASALQDFYVVIDLQAPTAADGTCPEWTSVIPRAQAAANPNPARGGGQPCTLDSDCGDPDLVCNEQVGTCVCLHNGWRRDSDDDSSKATSSSVFDFNGDGAAEVIYNDECEFRVYDGKDGSVYFGQVSRSRTGIENPVVADVDNDGNAEVVSVANTAVNDRCDDDPGTPRVPQGPNGLRVWGDPTDTWVSARRIWNQQSYSVTNVTEGGGVPAHAPESWGNFNGRFYNTYRSQPRSFGVAPDLSITSVSVFSPDSRCGTLSDNIDIVFEVTNLGDLRVGPGVMISFYGEWVGVEEQLLDPAGNPLQVTLTSSLEPGKSVILSVNFVQSSNGQASLPDRVRVVVDEAGSERECNEDNNEDDAPVEAGQDRPDLRLEVSAARTACPNAAVDYTLFNDGSTDVSDVVIRFYAGDPSAGGTQLAEITVPGPIAAGASVSGTVDIANLPTNRTIFVVGVADPDNRILECNEADNRDAADDSVRCTTIN